MIKAIIFDLDGTLLNTIEDLNDSVNKTYEALGYDCKDSVLLTMAKVGHGIRNLISQCFKQEDVEKAYKTFLEIYNKNYDKKTKPYNGIKELIDVLSERNILIGVNSNKNDIYTKHLIEKNFPKINLEYVLGHIEGVNVKPDPKGANLILEKMNVSNDECLYIGDSQTDYLTAINGGFVPLSVTWGFRSKEQLKEAGATNMVDSPMEILNYLEVRK